MYFNESNHWKSSLKEFQVSSDYYEAIGIYYHFKNRQISLNDTSVFQIFFHVNIHGCYSMYHLKIIYFYRIFLSSVRYISMNQTIENQINVPSSFIDLL